MLTDEQLSEIKQRLANATPGPWMADLSSISFGSEARDACVVVASCSGHRAYACPPGGSAPLADRELIARAPADLAALITEVERLRVAAGWRAIDDEAKNPVDNLLVAGICTMRSGSGRKWRWARSCWDQLFQRWVDWFSYGQPTHYFIIPPFPEGEDSK